MGRGPAIERQGARVLLVDAAGRVLLMHGVDPGRPDHAYWFTAGGGLDPGETSAEGAVRELYEETGLALDARELGEPVWHEVVEFPFDGLWYRQHQDFFLVRVETWDPVPVGFTEVEVQCIDEHRWWSVEELRASGEHFYPAQLPELLDRLLERT